MHKKPKFRSVQIFPASQSQYRNTQHSKPSTYSTTVWNSTHSIRSNETSNFELIADHHRKCASKKNFKTRLHLTAKMTCCSLISLVVLAGFASLIVGLVLINQKNTVTIIIVETTVSTLTTTTTTTGVRRAFALSQAIDGRIVVCASVNNSNSLYSECNDLKQAGLYGIGLTPCSTGWNTTLSSSWSAIAFCQLFLNSSSASFQAYYDCTAMSQARFIWSGNAVWTSLASLSYTKNLRCYY